MKRWIALALVIAAFCAMALGSGHKRPIDTSEPDVNALKPKPLPATAEELAQEEDAESKGPSFEAAVLYDRSDVTVTATGITYDDSGPVLGFLVENGSARTLRAALDGLDVNGYYVSAPLDLVCAPACRTYGKLPVDLRGLAVCGISEIDQLDLTVALTDAKTGSALPGAESVRIRTDAARENVCTADKTGRVIFYGDGAELTVKGRDGRVVKSADLVLCVGNTRDAPIRVELAGFAINGAGFETELVCLVPPGKVAVCAVPADKSALYRQKLWPVERYALRFEIYDDSSGDLLAATDTVQLDYADLRPLP